MSSKNVEIPYNLLAQGVQTVNYPANALYAQTMNAPAAVTLDMYLNNHLTDNRTIQPNYELNLENIDIDEVKVSMESNFNLSNITLGDTFSLPTGYNIIYNPNNNLIYTVTSYGSPLTIEAINSLGNVVYSYSSATTYSINENNFNQIVIDNLNNIYFILIESSNYYIVKFDSTLNLIKSVLIPTPYNNACILTIYNNNIYYIYASNGSALNIAQYSLSLTLINSSQISNTNIGSLIYYLSKYTPFIYNGTIYFFMAGGLSIGIGYIYSIDLNNIYNLKFINFNLPISYIGSTNGSIFIYNPNTDTTYLIYSNINKNAVIFSFQGNDINNFSISNYVVFSILITYGLIGTYDNNNNIWLFSDNGYGYVLTPNGTIYIILKTFSVTTYNFLYISTTSNSVIAINSNNAYFFNNPTSQQAINNSNYANSFNIILGCGCP